MNDPHEICAALRAYRIRGRIRQQLVARALGVAQSQISRWESGRDLPRPHNIEAIKSLIWGTRTQLDSLVYFVRRSALPLALFDENLAVLASSQPFQRPDSDLARFNWVFDPARNPDLAAVRAQYRDILADPRGTIGLNLAVPFTHDKAGWQAGLRLTIQVVDGQPLSIAEIGFTLRSDETATAPHLTPVRPVPLHGDRTFGRGAGLHRGS